MSDTLLTAAQISLLKKGLKFTPTPQQNLPELQSDMKEFCRRLRLKEHFFQEREFDSSCVNSNTDNDIDVPLVRNKSNWNPKPKRNPLLDTCIDTLTKTGNDLENIPEKLPRDNLKKSEQTH